MLKIDSVASTGKHEKCKKYVSFPWPPLVATHRKGLARVLYCSKSFKRSIFLPRVSYVQQIMSFPSKGSEDDFRHIAFVLTISKA